MCTCFLRASFDWETNFDTRVGKGVDTSIPQYVGLADKHAHRGVKMLIKHKRVEEGEEINMRQLELDSAVRRNARRANEDSKTWVRRLVRDPSRYFHVPKAERQLGLVGAMDT